MNQADLELELTRLEQDWPVPSAVDAVMNRVRREGAPRPVPFWRRRLMPVAAAAMLAVAATELWLAVLATPRTLGVELQRALEKSRSAHIVRSGLDDKGVRRQGDIWYERGRGFRAEATDQVIFDDGQHQWSWQPDDKSAEPVIVRRASHHAAAMITAMFHLDGDPLSATHQRDVSQDREIAGQPCHGFVVPLPKQLNATPDGPKAEYDSNPPRLIVLVDPDDRIVSIESQQQVNGRWQSGGQVTIAYDVPIPAEKLALKLPAGRVIDVEGAFADRFPLEKALATTESGGLLFAVHEVLRSEDETFYVVSSVRGTPEYLKAHPPERHRINLQTELFAAATQMPGSSADLNAIAVQVGSALAEGVDYMWWLAARHQYFEVENGKRRPSDVISPEMEVQPGKLRLNLAASYVGRKDPDRVSVVLEMPVTRETTPLAAVAARARRDLVQLSEAAGGMVRLVGQNGQRPNQITGAAFAREVKAQLDWYRSFDRIEKLEGLMTAPPDADGRKSK